MPGRFRDAFVFQNLHKIFFNLFRKNFSKVASRVNLNNTAVKIWHHVVVKQ